jgi:predicted nucleic acid-binding Zn ribbon protein
VTGDRSTVETWLRKMEKAADEHEVGDTWRATVFRQALSEAWAAGHDRGYHDCYDDTSRARHDARKATPAPPAPEEH